MAAIVGCISICVTLISSGVLYGNLVSSVGQTAVIVNDIQARNIKRDEMAALQANQLARIETTLTLIAPSLQRIESKIPAPPSQQ